MRYRCAKYIANIGELWYYYARMRIYGGDAVFEVRQTDEMINKTFRLPMPLLEELAKIAEHEKVSVNNLVRQCCEYALAHMKPNNK